MGELSRLSWFPQIPSSLFWSLDYAHPQRSTARDGLVLSMVLVITAREGDLFTEARNSLSVSLALSLSLCVCVSVCVRAHASTYVYIQVGYCMKTPRRPLCHYNRFCSSSCKTRERAHTDTHTHHASPDHTHTPYCATRVALCRSHTPWCAEQRRKMAHKRDQYLTARHRQSRAHPAYSTLFPLTHSSPTGYRSCRDTAGVLFFFYLSSSPAPALGTIC